MIPKSWQTCTIGELCQTVKGKAPIMKTKPGPYPLVTMGEQHKTADHYQLDTPAVCVPMISSFGHGKPGLKRVHYIEGKFALSNILTALIVKDPSRLSTRYLALYLNTFKDKLIVPLQTGAANMSLRPEKLASVPVSFPSLEEQEHIVRLLDEADSLCRLRPRADAHMDDFIPALFHQMFGDPAVNEMGWTRGTICDVGKVTTGNTPSTKNPEYYGDEIEWIKSDNINTPSHFLTRASVFLSKEGKKVGRTVPAGSILVTCIAGSSSTIGNAALADREVAFNQQINAITPHKNVDPYFLYVQILALRTTIKRASSGGMKGIVSKSKFEMVPVVIPPYDLQKNFATTFLEAVSLLSEQAQSRARLSALFESMLARAFAGEL